MKDILWSMTTTIREAERIPAFLKTAKEIENKTWDENTQKEFQIRLIKNREYLNNDSTQTLSKLTLEQTQLLQDKSVQMSYDQAREIFEAKGYEDPPMRGRQSMSPLEKLGLVDKTSGKIVLTDVGNKLLNEKIPFDEFMFEQLLKLQYPNMVEKERKTWNSKPFVNTLRLIKKVNELCKQNGMKEKGLTKIEFGIFALSIKDYSTVDTVAAEVIKFRKKYEALKGEKKKESYRKSFISSYLSSFNNPEKNTKEYTDNVIRYMRITKYIYIRGGNTCIDLEPRRMVEINSILANDNGSALTFSSQQDWMKYYGRYGAYKLPFDTVEKLTEIFNKIVEDVNSYEYKLNQSKTILPCPSEKPEIKAAIDKLRIKRTGLQNLEIKDTYHNDVSKIKEVINALTNIRQMPPKPSIALEKWVNIALNIIDDALLIKPNCTVGDDNEPTFTAPANVPDIECKYGSFNSICEVTMLTSRDQWVNEGQPVMRHLRDFEDHSPNKVCYCLFIAPTLHRDTVNLYYTSVKYEYEGAKQKIIPLTIKQLIEILELVVNLRGANKEIKQDDIKQLYDGIVHAVDNAPSNLWVRDEIPKILKQWKDNMVGSVTT